MDYSKEEQLKAAYALNLCTVSISQIIDYNDMNIMEQEYEAILNNLNLEQIPKDDALLKVLKQILDTITFFRIQEGDKKLIEKEYQQKMKNAIWNAVPNFGMIVAGGNPVTMAISLASQVGIGYMNYRKVKAEIQLDKERKNWELEASAIEQFNGLRRELFDTAWRLSDTYKFEDSYRLTERQIKQYDTILMDTDPIRRYERLDAVKDNFKAYPQFWYYFGHAANEISILSDVDEDLKSQYKALAISHFEKFEDINKYDILREDQLSSSCALEHIDLLDSVKDKQKILELIEIAIKKSGDSCDILQLCAIDYLKIGEPLKAMPLFKYLTNEDYNRITNAQFLSSLYVFDYIKNGKIESKNDYKLLEKRVRPEYLFPFPSENLAVNNALNDKYVSTQRSIIKCQFNEYLSLLKNKYEIAFNRVIPATKTKYANDDYYFLDANVKTRLTHIQSLSEKKNRWSEYIYALSQIDLSEAYFEIMNDLYISVSLLNVFSNNKQLDELKKDIDNSIRKVITNWILLQKDLSDSSYDGVLRGLEKIMEVPFEKFTKDFFVNLQIIIDKSIDEKTSIDEFIAMQNDLSVVCEKEGFPEPETLYENANKPQELMQINNATFDMETFVINNPYLVGVIAKLDVEKKMKNCIEKSVDDIVIDSHKCDIYVANSERSSKNYIKYFKNKIFKTTEVDKKSDIHGETIKSEAIAVLNDRTKKDFDIVFTANGLYFIKSSKFKGFVKYLDIDFDKIFVKDRFMINSYEINTDNTVEAMGLIDLLGKLADILLEQ